MDKFCNMSELREIVKRRIKQHRFTFTNVSKKLGYQHVNGLKYQLDQEFANWPLIEKIGKLINHDFTTDFPDMPQSVVLINEKQAEYSKSVTLNECVGKLQYYQKRIMELQAELLSCKDEIIRMQRKLPTY